MLSESIMAIKINLSLLQICMMLMLIFPDPNTQGEYTEHRLIFIWCFSSSVLSIASGGFHLLLFFTDVFSLDLNGGRFIIQSVFLLLLHGSLIIMGCAAQCFTVFLPAIFVKIFHSPDLITPSFSLNVCCYMLPHVKWVFRFVWNLCSFWL